MKNKLTILAVCLAIAFPMFAQKKQDERLAKSADAMREILAGEMACRRISSTTQFASSSIPV